MKSKPQLSFWQIWNMCFGFLGIQFGFALQNTNVSRIFQTLGASIDDIPILWIAAPVTGLLVQPVIGYLSDKTWNRLGRRRPYFLIGAVCSTLAIFIMPNSPALWVAAGMLWIMDASINISMEPFRAFVGDMLPDEQRTAGFAMQSFFIGTGAVVASALPWMMTNWLDISNTAPGGEIPDSVRYSFYCGGSVLLLAVLWTVIKTEEYSPAELQAFNDAAKSSSTPAAAQIEKSRSATQYRRDGALWFIAGVVFTGVIANQQLDEQLYILSVGACLFGLMQWVSGQLKQSGRTNNGFYEVIDDMFHMPKAMRQLAVVQFFSWFALFSLWIYATSAVTSYHYGATDTGSALYNNGADWVGVLFAAYNGFAALAAFAIPALARVTSRKTAHMINLCCGALGFISFIFVKDPNLLLLSMVGVGIAWASILSIPYAILSSALPVDKMGVYMGIFNFFIVIPQILAASVLGLLVRSLFDGQTIYALVLGGVCLMLAAVSVLMVEDKVISNAPLGVENEAA